MTGRTVTPIPLTITRDGDTVTVTGNTFEITLLQVIGEYKTDRVALRRIEEVWGCDRDTARLLLRAAREESKE